MPDLQVRPEAPETADRLYECLRDGRFVLADASGSAGEAAAGWKDRVNVVTVERTGETPAVALVRPDGYVAWAAEPGEAGEAGLAEEIQVALTEWCGKPASAA